jgi:molybdate transport system substrate-binding protein
LLEERPLTRRTLLKAALALAVLALPAPAWATKPVASSVHLRVAAAASTLAALSELAQAYQRAGHGVVELTPGASGKFFQQIAQGAPFDAFFSADASYPAELEEQGLASDRVTYAHGRLVLWAPKSAPFDVRKGLGVLRDPRVQHVAIANPQLAPYGQAAMEALEDAKLDQAIKPKLVLGENISQAAQFAQSGAADAGLLSLSLAVSPKLAPLGRYWLVPEEAHRPIVHDAVMVKATTHPAEAKDFLDFCTGPAAAPVWRRHGFEP